MAELSLYERVLSCPTLPTLPTVAVKLLEVTRDPDVPMHEIARLVQTDQGLAMRVLRTVNSSMYGLAQPCKTIDRAMSYLGLKAVRSLVLGFSIVDCTKDIASGEGFDLPAYWRRVVCAASGARHLAAFLESCDPDETFTAALFQDMGMLAAAVALRDAYYAAIAPARDDHDLQFSLERDVLGFDHAGVGADLAARWNLPAIAVACIRHHHAPDDAPEEVRPMVRTIHLGRLAGESLIGGAPAVARLLERIGAWFGKSPNDPASLLDGIARSSLELGDLLGKDLGELPDSSALIAMANERLVEMQLGLTRETEALRLDHDRLEKDASTDALTGAGNRKKFDHDLPALMDACASGGEPLSLIIIDADRFKLINDTIGHQAGDAVLRELAHRVVESVPQRGVVCRYGGEEFAVILPGCTLDAAAGIGEVIRRTVQDSPFLLAQVPGAPRTRPVTICVGVAATTGHPHGPACAELIRQADRAVYAAKEAGRNRVCVYGRAGVGRPAPDPAPDGRIHVLVVEDDALAASLLVAALAKHENVVSHWVRTVAEGKARIDRCAKGEATPPSLVLCDLMLGGESGVAIVEALRSTPAAAGARIVVLTASGACNDKSRCRRAGADEVVDKTEVAAHFGRWIKAMIDSVRPLRKAA